MARRLTFFNNTIDYYVIYPFATQDFNSVKRPEIDGKMADILQQYHWSRHLPLCHTSLKLYSDMTRFCS